NECGPQLAEIIVVDDASKTQPPKEISSQTRLIRNSRNLGYVRSVNLGVRACDTPYVLVMDSDAYALSNLAEATITAFEASSDLGAMAFALVGDKGEDTGATSPEPTILGLLLGQRLDTLLTSPWIGSKNASFLRDCDTQVRIRCRRRF